MGRHLLPNVVAPVMVLASLSAAGIILVEAGLSFIGAGVQDPTPAWGRMAAEANKTILTRSAWPLVGPAIAIILLVMSFNFVGDGVRDAFDPRLPNIRRTGRGLCFGCGAGHPEAKRSRTRPPITSGTPPSG